MHQEQTVNYNGFSNYETWLVYVWLYNDVERQAIIQEANDQEGGTNAKAAWLERELEELLQLQFDEMGDEDCNLWTELLAAAFGRVNWPELVD